MNKINEGLIFILGIFCLFCTFSLIFNLETIEKIVMTKHLSGIWAAVAVIMISGVGIELGARSILGIFHKDKLIIALIFSAYLFTVQLLLTVIPGISKCKCTTLRESIMKTSDWSQAKYSFGLLIYCLLIYFIIGSFNSNTGETETCNQTHNMENDSETEGRSG